MSVFQPGPVVPPRQYRAESLLALAVVEVGVGIVGGEYRQLAVGIDIPGVKAKAVAVLVVVVHLLQGVKILERPRHIALRRVILSYDIMVVVVDIHFFIVVGIFIVVWRRRINHARRRRPSLVVEREPEIFVKSGKRTYPLHILAVKPVGRVGRCAKAHKAAEAPAGLAHRR